MKCEKCGEQGAEEVENMGYTSIYCESCARVEVPYLFSD